jgi:hypothetical protein
MVKKITRNRRVVSVSVAPRRQLSFKCSLAGMDSK